MVRMKFDMNITPQRYSGHNTVLRCTVLFDFIFDQLADKTTLLRHDVKMW